MKRHPFQDKCLMLLSGWAAGFWQSLASQSFEYRLGNRSVFALAKFNYIIVSRGSSTLRNVNGPSPASTKTILDIVLLDSC